MLPLAMQTLTVCRKDAPALTPDLVDELLQQLPAWTLGQVDGIPRLQRRYSFRNFADALRFTNTIGALSESADHHPALLTEWGKVQVSWWTHVIGGLHQNDFIMAARCDLAYADFDQAARNPS